MGTRGDGAAPPEEERTTAMNVSKTARTLVLGAAFALVAMSGPAMPIHAEEKFDPNASCIPRQIHIGWDFNYVCGADAKWHKEELEVVGNPWPTRVLPIAPLTGASLAP
jgi:hypothetical protein